MLARGHIRKKKKKELRPDCQPSSHKDTTREQPEWGAEKNVSLLSLHFPLWLWIPSYMHKHKASPRNGVEEERPVCSENPVMPSRMGLGAGAQEVPALGLTGLSGSLAPAIPNTGTETPLLLLCQRLATCQELQSRASLSRGGIPAATSHETKSRCK